VTDYNTLRERRDIRLSGSADPLVTTIAEVTDTYRNTTSFEVFTCINIVGSDREWAGTQGTFVLSTPSITDPNHPDLLAFYTMDNISGSTLVDESPNNNDSTIVGATAVSGHLDNALNFTTNDYVDNGSGALIPTTGDFSVVLWFKPTNLTGTHTLLSQWQDSVTSTRFRIATSTLRLSIRHGSGTITTGEVLTLSTYQMITVQKTGSNIETFVNSISIDGPTAVSGTLTSAGSLFGANSTSGSVYNANVGTFLEGEMDQVRIFDRALTQPEIDTIYNSGVGA
jgi:hypothetical protein